MAKHILIFIFLAGSVLSGCKSQENNENNTEPTAHSDKMADSVLRAAETMSKDTVPHHDTVKGVR